MAALPEWQNGIGTGKTHPFHIDCGSCVAVRFSASREDSSAPFRDKDSNTRHRQKLAQFRLHIVPVPFPLYVYLVNQREKQRERVGGLGGM